MGTVLYTTIAEAVQPMGNSNVPMYVYQSMKDFLVFLKLTGLKIRDNTAVVDAYDNMSTLVGTDL